MRLDTRQGLTRVILVATIALMTAACGSTPAPGDVAPIEDRAAGGAGAGGAGAGGAGGTGTGANTGAASGGGVASIDLTKPGATPGVPRELQSGDLSKRSVYFEYDSNAVGDQYRPILQAHAGYLQRNRTAKMLVQGNTDERGGREYNLALGQRRADAVKRLLVLLGAQENQLESVSLGEEKPKKEGASEDAYRENRRADILYSVEQ